MKFFTFRKAVEHTLILHPDYADDLDVCIALKDPSVGPRAKADVQAVGRGIDWEQGRFEIHATIPIYSRTADQEIAELRKQLDDAYIQIFQLKRQLRQQGERSGKPAP